MVGRVDLPIAVSLALLLPGLLVAAEDAGSGDWLLQQLEARRLDELLGRAKEVPASLERDSVWIAAAALRDGTEAAVELAEAVRDYPSERKRVLVGAAMRCVRMREYDTARKLVQVATADEPVGSKAQERLALVASALFTGLRRHEELGITRSDPRFPAARMMETFAGASSDLSEIFAVEFGSPPASAFGLKVRTPAATDAAELGLKDFVFPPDVIVDLGLALSDFTITGDPALGWRVLQRYPFSPSGWTLFVVLEGGQSRLLGVAGGRMPPLLWGVGKRAGALVDAGDLAGARQWIEWARESLRDTRDSAWSRFFLRSTPEAITTADGLREAATALGSTGSLRLLASPGAVATAAPVVPLTSLPAGVIPFSERMTRPVLRSSPNGRRSPDYPLEAREMGVTGLLIVRCVLSVEGRAEECTIIKPLVPSLDREVLEWLARSSWSPVMLDGRPQRVSYVFNFNFQIDPGAAPSRR